MLTVSSINLIQRNTNNQKIQQKKVVSFGLYPIVPPSGSEIISKEEKSIAGAIKTGNLKEDTFTTSVKDALKQMMKDPNFDKKMGKMYEKNKFKGDYTSPRESSPVLISPDVKAFLAAGLPLEHAKDAANRLRNDGYSVQEIINAAKELQRISQQITEESLNKEYEILQAKLAAKAAEVEAKKTATLDTEKLALTSSQT